MPLSEPLHFGEPQECSKSLSLLIILRHSQYQRTGVVFFVLKIWCFKTCRIRFDANDMKCYWFTHVLSLKSVLVRCVLTFIYTSRPMIFESCGCFLFVDYCSFGGK